MGELVLGSIDLAPLLRAQQRFELFRQQLETDQEKAGAIQAFEFSYELAWKFTKRVLQAQGASVGSPRDAFRQAAAAGLIDDPKVWFDFLEKRSLTVHTYDGMIADEIIALFDDFSQALAALVTVLRSVK